MEKQDRVEGRGGRGARCAREWNQVL